MRWWSPHYFYLPLVFAAILAARAVEALPARAVWALVIPLAALSLHDDLRFRSDATLWQPEVAAQPACREGHFYLGEHARERQRWDEAAIHYERALTETPAVLSYVDRGAALQNLGAARLAQGRFADAREVFTAALAVVIDPTARRRITHNLAVAELRAGRPAEAARVLEAETARPDAFPESIFIRARALHDLGREDEASALVRRLRSP
jgi:tetratricopeptide (TPR) repeat protein